MKLTISILSAVALLGAPTAAMAGEFGVSNSYNFSYRHGRGTTHVNSRINGQLIENGKSLSIKTVHSQSGAGDLGNGYKDSSSILSINTSNTHFSENSRTRVRSNERYTFGSQQFTHRTGSFFAQ